mmetsp:Transcript_47546/g.136289  ORF Transcript_47546/g.136289 Transcript_47546/m.136289 type:complete len:430 (+) Transcript_47546:277-1566(+)
MRTLTASALRQQLGGLSLQRPKLLNAPEHNFHGSLRCLTRGAEHLAGFVQNGPAAQALRPSPREGSQRPATRGRADRHGASGVPSEEPLLGRGLAAQHGPENAKQWPLQLVLDVVLGVDRQAVLQCPQWVLGTLVGSHALGRGDENVRHAVADLWCESWAAPPDPLRELHVHMLRVIGLGAIAHQGLGEHQLPWVDAALPELRQRLAHIRDALLGRALAQDEVQAAIDDLAHELAPIPPNGLNAFGIQLAGFARLRPSNSCVALLVHQQIWGVHFLELHPNRSPKFAAHHLCRFFPERECLAHLAALPQAHHDRVCVSVDDTGVSGVPAGHAESLLHHASCALDHLASVGRDGGSDGHAWQGADGHTCESVHRVCRHLQRELPPVQDGARLGVLRRLQVLLRLRAGSQQLLQHHRDETASHPGRDEAMY